MQGRRCRSCPPRHGPAGVHAHPGLEHATKKRRRLHVSAPGSMDDITRTLRARPKARAVKPQCTVQMDRTSPGRRIRFQTTEPIPLVPHSPIIGILTVGHEESRTTIPFFLNFEALRASGLPGRQVLLSTPQDQNTWLIPNQMTGPWWPRRPMGWAMSHRRVARSRKEKRRTSQRKPKPGPWTTGPQWSFRKDWPTS